MSKKITHRNDNNLYPELNLLMAIFRQAFMDMEKPQYTQECLKFLLDWGFTEKQIKSLSNEYKGYEE